jgi:hypothetical protein
MATIWACAAAAGLNRPAKDSPTINNDLLKNRMQTFLSRQRSKYEFTQSAQLTAAEPSSAT